MEERWLWYLAGAVDTSGRIGVEIKKDERKSINYTIYPRIIFSRTGEYDVIFGMLDEYCDENQVHYYISTINKNNKQFQVKHTSHVKNFLNPIYSRLIQQGEAAKIILEEVIPRIEDDKHLEKEGFIEIMEFVDELRSHHPDASHQSKYDLDYFQAEFSE